MIEGVKVKKLRIIPDNRGRLMEILRCDDEAFSAFGQVYMTTAYPGIIKAWHYHKIQDDNFTCVSGKVKLVLYDSREDSPTRGEINEFYISLEDPKLVHIPSYVYHGIKCVSDTEAVVINTITKPYNHYDPDECRIDHDDKGVGYDWNKD